jgi:hypothetical protein
MLKLIYTETAPHLELLTFNLENWVEQRLAFAIATGQKMFVSSEKASFLLPDLICEATAVNRFLDRERVKNVTAYRCDLDRVEIGLTGYWLSTHLYSAEGVFVTQLPDRVESYLWELWRSADSRSIASDGVVG